jgi:hypothetical protein
MTDPKEVYYTSKTQVFSNLKREVYRVYEIQLCKSHHYSHLLSSDQTSPTLQKQLVLAPGNSGRALTILKPGTRIAR